MRYTSEHLNIRNFLMFPLLKSITSIVLAFTMKYQKSFVLWILTWKLIVPYNNNLQSNIMWLAPFIKIKKKFINARFFIVFQPLKFCVSTR